MKLRAMLEVLSSVTEEITNLVGLVSQSQMVEDESEETPEHEQIEAPEEEQTEDQAKKSVPAGVVEAARLKLLMELSK
jgi:hypothetical protein